MLSKSTRSRKGGLFPTFLLLGLASIFAANEAAIESSEFLRGKLSDIRLSLIGSWVLMGQQYKKDIGIFRILPIRLF